MDISSIRKEYKLQSLVESKISASPIGQFAKWFDEALKANVLEANAMILSTVSTEGRPSARVVLLKDFNESGFTFFTNYQSRKGTDLQKKPFASITFFWPELERQIRLEGKVEKLTVTESTEYFQSRPRESQIGAWASLQSEEIKDRKSLEQKFQTFSSEFASQERIPKPDFWGGYRLSIDYAEFWQGRPSRLHDRICYKKEGDSWKTSRLSP